MKKLVKIGLFCFCTFFISCSNLFVKNNTNAKEPEIIKQSSDVSITENDILELYVNAKSPDGGELYYEWYKSNDSEFTNSKKIGYDSEYVEENPSAGTYYYYCKITNKNTSIMISDKTEATIDSKIIKAIIEEVKIPYKVEHYKQNFENTYTLISDDSEILYGKANVLSDVTANNYEGYEPKTIEQQPIKTDGSTVIKVYYDRKTISLTFDLKGGTTLTSLIDGKLTGKYGDPFIFAVPEKAGFTFVAWQDGKIIPQTFPSKNETFTAVWNGNDVPYKVEHYLENILDDDYTLQADDTQNLFGVYGKKTIANAKLYKGFIPKEFEQIDIAEDGSSVVKIFYDRKRTTLSFDLKGGTTPTLLSDGKLTGKYGALVEFEAPEKENYTFISWKNNKTLPRTFPSKDDSFTAIWLGNYGGIIGNIPEGQEQGKIYSEGISINGTLLANTSEVIIVPPGTVATIEKSTDGVFPTNRKVKLTPFVMGQYEVTQELYYEVMHENPSLCKETNGHPLAENEIQKYRPVETMTWYGAISFCNQLTKLVTGSYESCVYSYRGNKDSSIWPTHLDDDYIQIDISQTGYRLPTVTEWEFAARGGDPSAECWDYACTVTEKNSDPEEFIWLLNNNHHGISGTHQVGLKKPNTLGLYDMCGNVWEWCNDYKTSNFKIDDNKYKDAEGYIVNPMIVTNSGTLYIRGGSWGYALNVCEINTLHSHSADTPGQLGECGDMGFRLVRTIE